MVVSRKPATKETIDKASCHMGTPPDGILAIITMDEENGIMLAQTAIGVSGLAAAADIMMKDKMIGIMIGNMSACASWGYFIYHTAYCSKQRSIE